MRRLTLSCAPSSGNVHMHLSDVVMERLRKYVSLTIKIHKLFANLVYLTKLNSG